jgi:hypothetical protein
VRVLFTTTGHSGHLLPLVPLARACERAGHEVLVVTHEPQATAVARVGLPVRAVAVAPDEPWAPLMSRIRGLRRTAQRLGREMAALPNADAAASALLG